MAKERTHYLVIKVTFNKAVGPRAAAALVRDYVPDHYYCSEWDDSLPSEFRVKSVKTS